MSAAIARRDPARSADLSAWLIFAGSVTLLLARPAMADGVAPLAALTVCYLGIGAAAISVPDRSATAPVLGRAAVLLLGLAAVLAVARAVGPWPPLRYGPVGIPVGLLAAVSEEALFRRLAYARLLRAGPAIAVVGTALAFALMHVPLYGLAAFPVDLGAGLLLSWQRWASGTWTVPAATHAAAQLVAMIR